MASTSEVGHAKNVANFYDLIAFVEGYGETYNPTKESLNPDQLNDLYTQGNEALNNVIGENSNYIVAVNTRFQAFNDLRPLSTRIINALDATEASNEIVKDARTINRKIQGQRASKKEDPLPDNEPVPTRISAAQQSYDQLVQHFAALISLLEAEPSYNPSEEDLTTRTLQTKLEVMIDKNEQVSAPYTRLSNARLSRNNVLYQNETGLVPIAFDVKKYVKSVYGASSPQYAQISGIKFKTRKAT